MGPERRTWLDRAEWGIRAVHEILRNGNLGDPYVPSMTHLEDRIRDFGYGSPDAKVVNYWTDAVDRDANNLPTVRLDDPNLLYLGIWRPGDGRLLAVVYNSAETTVESGISVIPPGGGAARTSARDIEAGGAATARWSWPGWSVRLLEVDP